MYKNDMLELAMKMLENDNMTKRKIIESIYGKPISISYQESARNYYHIVPAVIQHQYGLPKRLNAATEDALIDKIFDNLRGKSAKATLTDVYQAWMSERREDEDLAKHTIRKNECDWEKHFKPYPIAQAPIAEITPKDLKEHFKEITKGRCMRRKAFCSVKTLANALWAYAYDHNLAEANIAKGLSSDGLKFKVQESTADKTYTLEEREQICDYLMMSGDPLDLVIVMQFCLGARIGEVKALYWSDFDLQRMEVSIRRELVDDEGTLILRSYTKNGRDEGCRALPVTERAAKVLEKISKPENKDSYVFLWNGNPLRTQTINSHLERACKALGIRYLSTHKIRATIITESIAAGMDQASAMRLAGHCSPETMRNYVRVARVNRDIRDKFGLVCN